MHNVSSCLFHPKRLGYSVIRKKTAQQLESFVQSMGRNLSFSVDGTTGYQVVRVTNPQTGEVVRQLPSEELLKIAESMQQTGNSGLVNQKA